MGVFLILITDGEGIEFPPEIYLDERQAEQEAKHWVWALSSAGEFEVRHPFPGRWEVGIRDIRLLSIQTADFDTQGEWWVGIHWTKDGFPDPEGVLLSDRTEAAGWVRHPPRGLHVASTHEDDWLMSATFIERGEEAESVAVRAKVVCAVDESRTMVEYELDLVGTFVQSVSGSVRGRPGLSRTDIEELVEREWGTLSAGTDVLLESSWELQSFRELPH